MHVGVENYCDFLAVSELYKARFRIREMKRKLLPRLRFGTRTLFVLTTIAGLIVLPVAKTVTDYRRDLRLRHQIPADYVLVLRNGRVPYAM